MNWFVNNAYLLKSQIIRKNLILFRLLSEYGRYLPTRSGRSLPIWVWRLPPFQNALLSVINYPKNKSKWLGRGDPEGLVDVIHSTVVDVREDKCSFTIGEFMTLIYARLFTWRPRRSSSINREGSLDVSLLHAITSLWRHYTASIDRKELLRIHKQGFWCLTR